MDRCPISDLVSTSTNSAMEEGISATVNKEGSKVPRPSAAEKRDVGAWAVVAPKP